MVESYRDNRDFCVAALRGMPGVTVPEPSGAFYVFPRIDGLEDSFAFCRRLLVEQRVGLAPGSAFGAGGEGSLRICYAAERSVLEPALERLDHVLRAGFWHLSPGMARGRLCDTMRSVASRLGGKAALVTGGARGIGYAIAERLVDEGASVAVLALHTDSAERAVRELAARGGNAIALAGDISDEHDVRGAVEETVEAFGRLDIIVNNAATIAIGPLVDMTTETWDRVAEVNLRGVFLGCREAARQMIAQGTGGRIVNGSSGAGRRGNALISAYSASKFGVIGLTQSLAVELAPHGITVNAYCPGHVTSTPMWEFIDREITSLTGEAPGSARRAAEREAPLGRAALPAEIAAAVAFLASDDASFVTGESLLVDGGLVRL